MLKNMIRYGKLANFGKGHKVVLSYSWRVFFYLFKLNYFQINKLREFPTLKNKPYPASHCSHAHSVPGCLVPSAMG